jgi:hypothetical protein
MNNLQQEINIIGKDVNSDRQDVDFLIKFIHNIHNAEELKAQQTMGHRTDELPEIQFAVIDTGVVANFSVAGNI